MQRYGFTIINGWGMKMKKEYAEEKDLKDIIIMYNDTPEENEKKLHEEEEKSLKLKEWILK